MKNIPQKQTQPKGVVTGKQYSYPEIIDYLDAHWDVKYKDSSLATFKKLDQQLGSPSLKLNTILISGTNGKSLTAHFASRLLKQEGLSVGTLFAPHILTYNERIVVNNETISNKVFTDIANEVLTTAATLGVELYSLDLITAMALLHFSQQKSDIVLLEQSDFNDADPVTLCKSKITAITRVTNFDQTEKGNVLLEKSLQRIFSVVQPETYVISADQSKLHLQLMQKLSLERKANWAMPIRKLAPLPYPFEQLHGRSAALAERIAQIYVNNFLFKDTIVIADSLLIKQKGQRGRPTIEAKRNAEINPRKTIEQFWKDVLSTLPGRFQLLDKEKPTILLDNAANLDALQNLLLGIRLLHYHRPLKGLTLILGNDNPSLQLSEFLKHLRYFFKKTSGNVIICPPEEVPGHEQSSPWDAESVSNDIKNMKIKSKAVKNFKEAFELAQKSVDERHGLVVIAGSNGLITEYWRYKGMKKLQ
jgi:dihydrofolate synthase/folylpolyglutamate synthase